MDLGLRGRVCVVTGASRGIGRATAGLLAAEGASVLLVGRDRAALAGVAGELEGRHAILAADVTEPAIAERVLEAAAALGPIDVLVNNAGTMRAIRWAEIGDEEWQAQWELSVIAPMRLMRAIAPGMAERGWGRIVNVASSSAKRPSTRNLAYSVAKAAELSLSRGFADLFAARGVLVNAVTPGMVSTGLWTDEGGLADQVAATQGASREQVLERAAANIPLGRLGRPEDVAAVIVMLCSEVGANVAGAAWSVDGGTVAVII